MFFSLVFMWALLGWAGIVWPPQLPPPPAPGKPRWFSARLVNAIGAVAGGLLWNWRWPVAAQQSPGLGAAASCIGAVIGAALASDIVWGLFWRDTKSG